MIDSFVRIHLELALSSGFYGVLIEDCVESEMNLLETLSERGICSFGVCVRVRFDFIRQCCLFDIIGVSTGAKFAGFSGSCCGGNGS